MAGDAETDTLYLATILSPVTAAQLAVAVTAFDKVVGTTGREAKAIKAQLVPLANYLHALQQAVG